MSNKIIDLTGLGEFKAKLIEALESGDIVPALAANLEAWAEQSDLTVDDTWTDSIRTTAGENPIVTDEGGKLISIAPETDFTAKKFITSPYNQLRLTTLGESYVGGTLTGGCYFIVPKLTYGQFGNAEENNGILFTNSSGENMNPTVRFKALASGVPTSTSDGTALTPTSVTFGGKNYKTFVTDGPGWLIVSGIDTSTTCAHIAWEDWYDKYVSIGATGDVCGIIVLESFFALIHADKTLRVIGSGINSVSDSAEFGATGATWYRRVDKLSVGAYSASSGSKWTDTANVGESETTYTHSVTISAMKSGGLAKLANGTLLDVDGTTVSYTDTTEHAPASDVFYELATIATGTKAYTDSVFSGSNIDTTDGTFPLNDCGLEILVSPSGAAYVTTCYAQNYPDAVAEIVRMRLSNITRVVSEAIVNVEKRLEAMTDSLGKFGKITADSIDVTNVTRCLYPDPIIATGAPSASLRPLNLDDSLPWDAYPAFIGQRYVDKTSKKLYMAVGVGAVSDWIILN